MLGDPWSAQDVDARTVDELVFTKWTAEDDHEPTFREDPGLADLITIYTYSSVYRPSKRTVEPCVLPAQLLRTDLASKPTTVAAPKAT